MSVSVSNCESRHSNYQFRFKVNSITTLFTRIIQTVLHCRETNGRCFLVVEYLKTAQISLAINNKNLYHIDWCFVACKAHNSLHAFKAFSSIARWLLDSRWGSCGSNQLLSVLGLTNFFLSNYCSLQLNQLF